MLRSLLVVLPLLVTAACAGGAESTGSANQDVVESIRSMVQRPDGNFDVTCRDGHSEVVTADQLRANDVCGTGAPSHPTPPPSSTVTYTCDGNANLILGVLAADGTESTRKVSLVYGSTCSAKVQSLTATRHVITRPSIIGVCDANATLQRFGVMPDGSFFSLPSTPLVYGSTCATEETVTNAPLAAVSVPTALVQYTCDANANLQLLSIGSTGAVAQASVPMVYGSTCAAAAQSLRKTRSDVQSTVMLGACDSSATLHRFSVTPTTGLKELTPTPLTYGSTCQQQMDALNQ